MSLTDDESNLSQQIKDIHVMTIVVDKDQGGPQVDLGDMDPWFAATVFRHVADAIEMTLHPPKIVYEGDIIFDAIEVGEDD